MQAPLIAFRASLMPVLPGPFESLTTSLENRVKKTYVNLAIDPRLPDVYQAGLPENVEIHILQLGGKAAGLLSVHPYGQVEIVPSW